MTKLTHTKRAKVHRREPKTYKTQGGPMVTPRGTLLLNYWDFNEFSKDHLCMMGAQKIYVPKIFDDKMKRPNQNLNARRSSTEPIIK